MILVQVSYSERVFHTCCKKQHFLMLWNVHRKVLTLESVFNKALASNVLQELFNSFFDIARETIFEKAHGGLVLCIFESGAQGKTFVVLLVHFNQNPYLLPESLLVTTRNVSLTTQMKPNWNKSGAIYIYNFFGNNSGMFQKKYYKNFLIALLLFNFS